MSNKTEKPVVKAAAENKESFFSRIKNFNFSLRKQRFKYGTMATVLSILIIAAIILANVLVGIASDKYGLKFDMTSEKRFELSDVTKDLIHSLEGDEDIMLHIFMTEENFRAQTYGNEMTEIMYRYQVESNGRIKVNFVDPVRNPAFVTKYSGLVSISNGSLVVEKGDKYRAFSLADLYYYYDSTNSSVVGVSIERRITMALNYMNTANPPTAAILVGHSELNANNIATQLYEANYNVISLNLMTDEIPDDVTLLVINCPTTDYTEDEILKVEKYLAGYRDMIYVTGSDAPVLTNLELLFREWGVAFEDAIICDSSYRVNGVYANVVSLASNTEDTLTSGLGSKYVVTPNARPMTILKLDNQLRTVTELMQTSPYSYAKLKDENTTIESYERTDDDLPGTFSTVIRVSNETIINNQATRGSILFISSPYVFDSALLNTDSYANMRLTTNIVNEFNKSSSAIELRSKKFTDPELEVIGNQLTVVLLLLCVIPAAIIIMGILVWYRRENR